MSAFVLTAVVTLMVARFLSTPRKPAAPVVLPSTTDLVCVRDWLHYVTDGTAARDIAVAAARRFFALDGLRVSGRRQHRDVDGDRNLVRYAIDASRVRAAAQFEETPPRLPAPSREGSRARLAALLRYVPEDAIAGVAVDMDPADLLAVVVDALPRALRKWLHEGMRRSGVRGGLSAIARAARSVFEPGIGIVLRDAVPRRSPRRVAEASPLPACAFVMRAVKGYGPDVVQMMKQFRDRVRYQLGFDGVDAFYRFGPKARHRLHFWDSPRIAPIGQLAVYWNARRQILIVGTDARTVQSMVRARGFSYSDSARYFESAIRPRLDRIDGSFSGFAWMRGENVANLVRRFAIFDVTPNGNVRDGPHPFDRAIESCERLGDVSLTLRVLRDALDVDCLVHR